MNIKQELYELVDEKYKRFHSNICPGINNILGIRVPVLRRYAKELNKQYSLKELFYNIGDDYYEEIMLKGMIIGLNIKYEWKEIKNYIEEYVPKIDNWAICDTFCTGLKITHKYKKEMWRLINQYINSNSEFEVRFAIVMILDYYIEKEYIQKYFEIFSNIKLDKYYVKMALAWAISISLIKFYDETINYLKNECELDDWTYNKAIQKAIESYRITKKQKEELRKMKK